jgi:hypothetical protein
MRFTKRETFKFVLTITIAILFVWLIVSRTITIHNNIQEQERQEKIWREEYEAHR